MKELLKKWNAISLVKRIICGLIIGSVLGFAVPGIPVISILDSYIQTRVCGSIKSLSDYRDKGKVVLYA